MKRKQITAILMSAILTVSACMPMNSISAMAAENAGAGATEVAAEAAAAQEPQQEPAAEPTQEPAAEPTQEPAAEPTQEPAAEPSQRRLRTETPAQKTRRMILPGPLQLAIPLQPTNPQRIPTQQIPRRITQQ